MSFLESRTHEKNQLNDFAVGSYAKNTITSWLRVTILVGTSVDSGHIHCALATCEIRQHSLH